MFYVPASTNRIYPKLTRSNEPPYDSRNNNILHKRLNPLNKSLNPCYSKNYYKANSEITAKKPNKTFCHFVLNVGLKCDKSVPFYRSVQRPKIIILWDYSLQNIKIEQFHYKIRNQWLKQSSLNWIRLKKSSTLVFFIYEEVFSGLVLPFLHRQPYFWWCYGALDGAPPPIRHHQLHFVLVPPP